MESPPESQSKNGQRHAASADSSLALVVPKTVILVAGTVFTLFILAWAKAVLMPVALAILLHFALAPLLRQMKRIGLGPRVGAFVIVTVVVMFFALLTWRVAAPAMDWMKRVPETLPRIEAKLRELREPLRLVEEASVQVEKMTETPTSVLKVEVKEPGVSSVLWSGAQDFFVTCGTVLILLYFLLASEGAFQRKLVNAMPRTRDKKRTVEVIQAIEQDVSSFLLTTLVVGICVGIAEGIAMALLGMPNPWLWGAIGASLNWIPYIGAVVGTTVVGLAAFSVFDSAGYALLVPVVFFSITSLEGSVITPLVVGKRLTLNPVVLFVWLALWTWMWGLVGSVIAVPMLAALRIVCAKIPGLGVIEEFLSDRAPEALPASIQRPIPTVANAEPKT